MGKNLYQRKESERQLALVEATLLRKQRKKAYEEQEKEEAAEKQGVVKEVKPVELNKTEVSDDKNPVRTR